MVFLSGVNAIRQYISKRLHTIVAMAMVITVAMVWPPLVLVLPLVLVVLPFLVYLQ